MYLSRFWSQLWVAQLACLLQIESFIARSPEACRRIGQQALSITLRVLCLRFAYQICDYTQTVRRRQLTSLAQQEEAQLFAGCWLISNKGRAKQSSIWASSWDILRPSLPFTSWSTERIQTLPRCQYSNRGTCLHLDDACTNQLALVLIVQEFIHQA